MEVRKCNRHIFHVSMLFLEATISKVGYGNRKMQSPLFIVQFQSNDVGSIPVIKVNDSKPQSSPIWFDCRIL